jgi:pimeloyl-ACP methyl ester carboxylesterase
MSLEIISRETENPKSPILFVHGAYVGAWCWEAHFLDWFAARGYPAYAVSLRGHGASPGRKELDRFGIADYTDDLAEAVKRLPRPPVLVGHSMGALVVQKYLERASVSAAILACPVPPYGLMPSSFSLAFTRPALFAQINSLAAGGRVSSEALGEALFAGPLEQTRLESYYQRMQRESRRALMDMAGFGLPSLALFGLWQPRRVQLPEMLVLGAERDVLIAPSVAESAARILDAEYKLLPGLGHAVMLDARWESAAQAMRGWLEERGL